MTGRNIAQYRDLAGKTVFVSGGASGIGGDMVRAFHDQEAFVWFVDVDEGAAVALCAELEAEGGTPPRFLRCDVTDMAALAAAVERAATETGRLDVLVNNAANDTRRPSAAVTAAEWDAIVAVNLKHQHFATMAAFPHMQAAGGGSVINFGSIAPRLGVPDLTVYSTCKAAVLGLTRSLAREFGAHGVRVNAIVPGAILTERQLALWISPEDERRIRGEQCLDRRLLGTDVAQMALFLASDVSSACTSQGFIVDGGLIG
ncbi:MAG: SDR family oxidoreductase [Sneathiellaceae bacterium]